VLTWNLAASMKAGVPYAITAQVLPAVAGVAVTLNNGATVQTDPSGKAIFSVSNSTPGFVPYQLSIASDQQFSAVHTDFVTVWVR